MCIIIDTRRVINRLKIEPLITLKYGAYVFSGSTASWMLLWRQVGILDVCTQLLHNVDWKTAPKFNTCRNIRWYVVITVINVSIFEARAFGKMELCWWKDKIGVAHGL